jgi:hypothetical protein
VALPGTLAADAPTSVATFHSLGLYWSPANGSADIECQVRYRAVGSGTWHQALPLWFDDRDGEYRGSIIELEPATSYEIELTLEGTATTETFTATTWSESFPLGQTIELPASSSQRLVIDQAGTAAGYLLYTFVPANGEAVIDVAYNDEMNIEITGNAAYVILRGLTLRRSTKHGIRFTGGAHDIVIERCDISGWGTKNNGDYTTGTQAAIFANSNQKVERIVVQRNRMYDPRANSHSWVLGHPDGPQAVSFYNSLGNHVIRYNEVWTDNGNYYNDALGAGSNDSFEGFPNRDSDIYGNYIAQVWDDGIESEGANRNVRIWGNFIEENFVKIASASTATGPLYIWRNIAGTSRYKGDENGVLASDDYGRGYFLKMGGEDEFNYGRTYVFHNTVLQPDPPPGQTYPLGGSGGIISSGGTGYEHISRNNILMNYKGGTVFRDDTDSCTNDFDYDLYNGNLQADCTSPPHQSHGILLPYGEWPQYDPANGAGEFALAVGTPGHDAGQELANFNDGYEGAAPDMGAFERGSPPMEFGVDAYLVNFLFRDGFESGKTSAWAE